jgi:hypothetical protein
LGSKLRFPSFDTLSLIWRMLLLLTVAWGRSARYAASLSHSRLISITYAQVRRFFSEICPPHATFISTMAAYWMCACVGEYPYVRQRVRRGRPAGRSTLPLTWRGSTYPLYTNVVSKRYLVHRDTIIYFIMFRCSYVV